MKRTVEGWEWQSFKEEKMELELKNISFVIELYCLRIKAIILYTELLFTSFENSFHYTEINTAVNINEGIVRLPLHLIFPCRFLASWGYISLNRVPPAQLTWIPQEFQKSFGNARTGLKPRSKWTQWEYCWRTIPALLSVELPVCFSVNEQSSRSAWMTFTVCCGRLLSVQSLEHEMHLRASFAREWFVASEDDTGDSTSLKKSILGLEETINIRI